MNYGQCLAYLEKVLATGIKFGLTNVRVVLEALGQPHQAYPSVLVAGTNGKGSVCAMLANILQANGLRVGLYTSPHLVSVEERVKVQGKPISRWSFCRELTFLKGKIDQLIVQKRLKAPLTYFETLTCLAFLYFRRQKVDIAVLEVGMGGRLDATNVVTPVVSVITTISKDHEEFLGRTLAQIAREKAGVVKPRVPVICGPSRGRAYQVIRARASALKAPFIPVFGGEHAFSASVTPKGHRFRVSLFGQNFTFRVPLPGEHQGRNAAVALTAALMLHRTWRELKRSRMLAGLRRTRWPGRLEIVSRRPLVVLDGAHNEEGARSVRSYVLNFLPPPRTLVFAIMRDKHIGRVARILFPLARTVILTTFPYRRAASPDEVRRRAQGIHKKMLMEPDTRRAILRALEITPAGGSILITGSLFLVGQAKRLFPEWDDLRVKS